MTSLTQNNSISFHHATFKQNLDRIKQALDLAKDGKNKVVNLHRYIIGFWSLVQEINYEAMLINNKKLILDPEKIKIHREIKESLKSLVDKIQAVTPFAAADRPAPPQLRPGETPLHFAVRNHDHALARALRIAGHPLNIPNSQQLTPLEEAVLQGDEKMKNILLFANWMENPQVWAEINQQFAQIEHTIRTLNQVNPATLTPICEACYNADVGKILELANETNLDIADANGLKPLHYALLGKSQDEDSWLMKKHRQDVISLLIQKLVMQNGDFQYKNKDLSYLDYALISGNSKAYDDFSRLFHLSFNLDKGPSADRAHQLYAISSGIFNEVLQQNAAAKDPIRMNGSEALLGGVNGLWGIMRLAQGFFAEGGYIHGFARILNRHFLDHVNRGLLFNRLIEVGWLPKQLHHAVTFDSLVSMGFFAFSLISSIAGYPIAPNSRLMPLTGGIIPLVFQEYTKPANQLAALFSVVKTYSVARSVIPKISAYWQAFKSRPAQVLKRAAVDVLSLGVQVYMCYEAFNTALYPTVSPSNG